MVTELIGAETVEVDEDQEQSGMRSFRYQRQPRSLSVPLDDLQGQNYINIE